MCLMTWIRALITTIVLASHSPLGLVIDHGEPESGRGGRLAISLFIGRRTRVAASQHFDVTSREIFQQPVTGGNPATSRCCFEFT
jgi:hypothetical protein